MGDQSIQYSLAFHGVSLMLSREIKIIHAYIKGNVKLINVNLSFPFCSALRKYKKLKFLNIN